MRLENLAPYGHTILQACLLFPFIAALFTIPFMVVNYRKYGGIAIMRVLVVYSFILYSMCAFLLTVLPLPSRAAVAQMTPRPIGWIPFTDLNTGLVKSGILVNDPSTWTSLDAWKTFLRSRDLFTVLANIVMQIPLGFYLRYYFRCSKGKTFLIGLLVSLFYELTQLSGLFFIYPHPYRYTEVDDLICNTLGTMIGYAATPVLAVLLPSRSEIDRISYQKGQHITLLRRMLAAVLDTMVLGALISTELMFHDRIAGIIRISPTTASVLLFVLYFAILPCLTGGRTPGQALLRLRVIHSTSLRRPSLLQLLIRNVLLYVVEPFFALLNMGALLVLAMLFFNPDPEPSLRIVMGTLCLGFILGCMWYLMRCQRKYSAFPHGHYSRTQVVRSNASARK